MSNPSGVRQHYADEELLTILHAMGDRVTQRQMRQEPGPDPTTYVERFGSWRKACERAGVACGNRFGE